MSVLYEFEVEGSCFTQNQHSIDSSHLETASFFASVSHLEFDDSIRGSTATQIRDKSMGGGGGGGESKEGNCPPF